MTIQKPTIERKKPLGKKLNLNDEQLAEAAQVSQMDVLNALAFWDASVPDWAKTLISARRKTTKVEEA